MITSLSVAWLTMLSTGAVAEEPGETLFKKNSGDIWDAQTLDTYLADPRKFMPGTKMVFAGLKNPEDRKALIEYLKEQH